MAELQESLAELGRAMEVTEAYVAQTHHLITTVLPELSNRILAEAEAEAITADPSTITRERAHELAERTLRAAAEAEVDTLLDS